AVAVPAMASESLYSEGLPISGSGHRPRRGGVSRKPELTSLFWRSVISEAGKTDDLPAQTGSCQVTECDGSVLLSDGRYVCMLSEQVCAPLFGSPALSAQLLEINELSAEREALKEAFPWGMSLQPVSQQLSQSMIDICAHLIRSLRPMAWQHNELLLLLSPKSFYKNLLTGPSVRSSGLGVATDVQTAHVALFFQRSLQWRGAELILANSLHVGAEMIGASCSEVMIDKRCDIPAVCQQHPLTALLLARCSNTVTKESVLTKHLFGQPWSNEALCHFSTAFFNRSLMGATAPDKADWLTSLPSPPIGSDHEAITPSRDGLSPRSSVHSSFSLLKQTEQSTPPSLSLAVTLPPAASQPPGTLGN
ncbi:Cell division protein SepF, partial [Dissostichus eleginoides]